MHEVRLNEALKKKLADIKPNTWDKVVKYFAPIKAAERYKARMVMAIAGSMGGGYNGASKSRRGVKEFNPGGGSADSDINPALGDLIDRSRDLVRNDPLSCGAIHTNVNSVVGTGLRLKSIIDYEFLGLTEEEAKVFQKKAERGFKAWADHAESCDLGGKLNFYQHVGLTLRSSLENGDCFIITPYLPRTGYMFGLKLQHVEADRVSNPQNHIDTQTMIAGVEVDLNDMPVRYHIQTTHPGDMKAPYKREWKEFAAYSPNGRKNVIHFFRKIRIGQHRGVPYLAPVIETLKQLSRYTEAELMAAVISGMFAIFIKTPGGEGLANLTPEVGASESSVEEDIKLAPGLIANLAPGEDITSANPTRPNQAFDGFVIAMCRYIGVALELPYEVLVKHFTASYSASRAALLEAYKAFMNKRFELVTDVCKPIYELWMTEAVASGYLYAPGFFQNQIIRDAYLGSQWIGPILEQIDPTKEIAAAKERVALRITTRGEECEALTATDWEAKVPQILRDIEMFEKGTQPAPANNQNQNQDQNNQDNQNNNDNSGGSDNETN